MRKIKWSLKLYKLQLLSIEGTLFGGPAGVKLLKLVEQAIENDYRRKRFDFRDPETNEKYTRKYSIVSKAGEIMISVGRYTTPDDYAQICIQVSDRVEFPYLALLDYKPAFKDARTLLKVVKIAFNKILVEKGGAVDIRTSGYEQAIVYAAILINYAKESQQEFDELLIERNRYGAVWVHFAVRPKDNRNKVNFINA